MEDFNFDVPINATVIFYDSDNETSVDDLHITEVQTNNNSPNTINETKLENISDHNKLLDETEIVKEIRSNSSPAEGTTFGGINICHNDLGAARYGGQKNKKADTETLYNHKSKLLSMPSLESDYRTLQGSNVSFDKTYDNIDSQTDKSTKRTTNSQRKNIRKKSTDEEKCSKRKRKNEFNPNDDPNIIEVQEENTVRAEINDGVFQDHNLPKGNTETVLTKSPQRNHQTGDQITDSIEINQDQTVKGIAQDFNQQRLNTSLLLDQQHNENIEEISNVHNELLKTVSEHMIYIINSHFSCIRINRTNTDQSLIEHVYNNFIRTKRHFFELSYSTVVSIIIPRKNNTTFLNNFLNDTVKLAGFKLSRSQIKNLFIEMVHWVTERRQHIQQMQIINLNKTSHPYLMQRLLKPKPQCPPPYPNQDEQINKKETDITPDYSSGSSGRNQNLDLTFQNKHNSQTQVWSPADILPQNTLQHKSDRTHHKQNAQKQSCYPPVMALQNTRQFNEAGLPFNKQNAHIQSYRPAVIPPQNTGQYNADLTLKKQNAQSQPYYPVAIPPRDQRLHNYKNQMNMQPQQNTSFRLNNDMESMINQVNTMQPLPNFSDIHIRTSSCAKQATQSCQMPQSWQKQATYYFGKKDVPTNQNFHKNHQELHESLNNQNLRPENPAQVESNRSSISRDSGFISPLNFNRGSDQMFILQEEQKLQATPLIAHVTSLNPNVSYISEGLCTVCGQTTKNKCIRCYKCYYCSHSCQVLDWKKHQMSCN